MVNSVLLRTVSLTAAATLAGVLTAAVGSDWGGNGWSCRRGIDQARHIGPAKTLNLRLSWALETPACQAVNGSDI